MENEENKTLIEDFRHLKEITSEVLTDDDVNKIETLINENIDNLPQTLLPFGLNPLHTAVQTAIVYSEDIGLNRASLISMLAMPFVFYGGVSADEMGKLFGEEVTTVLRGMEKVHELYSNSPAMATENFRSLLMVLAEDMRVILILIADRLNIMRLIKDLGGDDDRKKIAREAAQLYAPLAHKLGLYLIKSELEDLSLKYLEHDIYYMIREKLHQTKKSRDAYVESFIKPIEKALAEEGMRFHVKGRTKSIHSIWQKMKKQRCRFEDIYDLFAIRIILDSEKKKEKHDCWKAYSIVTDMYVPNTSRLRDWITVPKNNGYESLHTTVMGPDGKWVEIQIRTERMDEVAERGVAAHWRYKGVKDSGAKMEEWLNDVRMALELNDDDPLALEKQFKVDVYNDDVFVFTPKGDLVKLPQGSTLLDFAYMIHTNVGTHCSGGKVNGKNVQLKTVLKSGDQVEIFTNPRQQPKRDWLSFAKTAKARAKIKQNLTDQEMQAATMAKETIERKFKNRKITYDEAVMMRLVKRLGYKHVIEFYKAIVEGVLDVNTFIEKYVEAYDRANGSADIQESAQIHSAEEWVFDDEEADSRYKDMLVIDKNIKGVDYSLAKCCNPIYGDRVFGFVTSGRGIKIHRFDCPNAKQLRENMAYRIIPARWAGKGNSLYPVTLTVVGHDDIGIVNNITSILNKEQNVILRSINIKSAEDGLFSGTLTVQIDDNNKLKNIIKKLKGVKGVKNVTR